MFTCGELGKMEKEFIAIFLKGLRLDSTGNDNKNCNEVNCSSIRDSQWVPPIYNSLALCRRKSKWN
jgi:hypothetical protein